MKRHLIHLAGLTLAVTIYAQPNFAPGGPPAAVPVVAGAPGTPPPPGRIGRTQIEVHDEDDDGDRAFARAAGDASTVVRKIFAGGDSGDRPLIITSSAPDEKSLATLDEDLNIMARVLNKSIERGGDDDRKGPMGIHLWAIGQGNRPARNFYLDGYGAVFMLNVNMPLLAPPSKPQVEEKKNETSSSWEEARNELYGHEDRSDFKRTGDKRPSVPFDSGRVEALKKDLIEALKNATHIRGLKDSENVTVVVQGPGSDQHVQRTRAVGPKKGEIREDVFSYAFSVPGAGPRSVMTLRAKKSDIDAFAKGKTELDDFRKKVSVAVYQTPGGGGSDGAEMRLRRQ